MSAPETAGEAELWIRIGPLREGSYPVKLKAEDGPDIDGSLAAGALSQMERRGETLFAALFADPELATGWTSLAGRYEHRRVRLEIAPEAPELHGIPWELLERSGPGGPPEVLAADARTPFSRYLGSKALLLPPVPRPLRLLVAVASPPGLDVFKETDLDEEREVEALAAVLEPFSRSGTVEWELLKPPVTLADLEAKLLDGFHALHLVAHGRFQDSKGAVLLAKEEGGQAEAVDEDRILKMLASQRERSLRLIFLASCRSAARSPVDAYRGLGPSLARFGVPAVIAMRDDVKIETARAFAARFYQRLLTHGAVDRAVNEARSHLLTLEDRGAGLPVLFMSLKDGLLLETPSPVEALEGGADLPFVSRDLVDGRCTLVLGPGIAEGVLPTPDELVQGLGREFPHPWGGTATLAAVAQYLDALRPGSAVREVLRRLEGERRAPYGSIHERLAELELPLYLYAGYDDALKRALEARGRRVRTWTVPWRSGVLSPVEPPAAGESVIVHLLGSAGEPSSLVVTEDDYLDYLARVARDARNLLPPAVGSALTSRTLLFLGFDLKELPFRILLRGLLPYMDFEQWRGQTRHVAVQVDPATTEVSNAGEAREYLVRYFANVQIGVNWNDTGQFVEALVARWRQLREDRHA